jgi:hypothetical protein
MLKSMMRSGSRKGVSMQDEREYAERAALHLGEFLDGKRRKRRRMANQLFRSREVTQIRRRGAGRKESHVRAARTWEATFGKVASQNIKPRH